MVQNNPNLLAGQPAAVAVAEGVVRKANENPKLADNIFLSYNQIHEELHKQSLAVEHKYNVIGICTGVVLAVAIIVAIYVIGIPAYLAIQSSSDTGLALLLLFIFGPSIVAPILGYGSYMILMMIQSAKMQKIQAISNSVTQEGNSRIKEAEIKKMLKNCNDEAIHNFLKEMDFMQLHAAKESLGCRKFHNFLSKEKGSISLQHDLWKAILSLDSCLSRDDLIVKMKEIHKLIAQEPEIKSIILKHLCLVMGKDAGILAAKTWAKNPEVVQANAKEELEVKHKYAESSASPKNSLVNDVVTLNLVPANNNGKTESIKVSRSILLDYGKYFSKEFFATAYSENEHPNDLTLEGIEDVDAFKKTIQLLSADNLNQAIDDDMILRIINCSNKYFCQFFDNLHPIFSRVGLINKLIRPSDCIEKQFNHIKNFSTKRLKIISEFDFNWLESEPKNIHLVRCLKVKQSLDIAKKTAKC